MSVDDPKVRVVGFDEQGQPMYELNLTAVLIVAYQSSKEPAASFAPGSHGRERLVRFAAAVDARIASDALVGKVTSVPDAAIALAGGATLVGRIVARWGAESALDLVLDHVAKS